eukprot:TRINITY_DN7130_c0_g1_i2.p1 TRINITY_DN7130_c0_g1~~TRINITY_DN7130_c0_g1_i2.p1  ORF type:complete len:162 (-),score=49.46 TRINITY_DN7130_c0_g1_i2:182-667(-)
MANKGNGVGVLAAVVAIVALQQLLGIAFLSAPAANVQASNSPVVAGAVHNAGAPGVADNGVLSIGTLGGASLVSLVAVASLRSISKMKLAAEGKQKINSQIDLESPKVVNQEKLSGGDKKVYCRCWLSKTFPLCDGAHAKHNEETGDNVGPLIVSVEKPES